MSVQDDLLNDEEVVFNENDCETGEHIQMCSNQQDELKKCVLLGRTTHTEVVVLLQWK